MSPIYRFLLCSLLFPLSSHAQSWSFSAPLDVTTPYIDKVFHHLESSGRRNIAVTKNIIAIAWEDNRTGMPAIYLALKNKNSAQFSPEIKISGQGEAYEPGIVALAHKRFALSWEEDGKISVGIINAADPVAPQIAKVFTLPDTEAMQAAITTENNRLYVAYSRHAGRFNRIRLAGLEIDTQNNLRLLGQCNVDPEPLKDDQLYPAILMTNQKLMLAWEDRRRGHTIIMGSLGDMSSDCHFSPPQRISKRPGKRKLPYGKGYGVSRVSLMRYGSAGIMAAWADKRNFREGYDIYAAEYDKAKGWGSNHPVQDDFGGVARQWHTTLAGHANGQRLAAWSDEREGTSDIFYSWFEQGEWSEDMPLPGASGPGEQAHSSMVLDDDANLHIAWVERKEVGGITRLRYLFARLQKTEPK